MMMLGEKAEPVSRWQAVQWQLWEAIGACVMQYLNVNHLSINYSITSRKFILPSSSIGLKPCDKALSVIIGLFFVRGGDDQDGHVLGEILHSLIEVTNLVLDPEIKACGFVLEVLP